MEAPSCAALVALNLPEIANAITVTLADDPQSLQRLNAATRVFREVQQDEHLWEEMAKRRFGRDVQALNPLPAGCPLSPWQALYYKLSRLRNALSDQERSSVTWGSERQYWSCEEKAGSKSGRCMRLGNVCWLHLDSTWRGVSSGTYRLVWRMHIHEYVGGIQRLKMDAYATASRDTLGNPLSPQPGDAPIVNDVDQPEYVELRVVTPGTVLGWMRRDRGARLEATAPVPPVDVSAPEWDGMFFRSKIRREELLKAGAAAPGRWAEIEAGRVVVPPGCVFDVKARMYDVNNDWKSNVTWDYVALERVSDDGDDKDLSAGSSASHGVINPGAAAAAGPAAAAAADPAGPEDLAPSGAPGGGLQGNNSTAAGGGVVDGRVQQMYNAVWGLGARIGRWGLQ